MRRASALNVQVASKASVKIQLSGWENGKTVPNKDYRPLFREIYGRTNAELGFPDEPEEDPEAAELRSRLAVARSIDAQTVELFFQQIDHARKVDRRFGGLTQLHKLRTQIHQVQDRLTHSIGGARSQLAGALMEASTLAGSHALDRAALGQAWTHYERAKLAAPESNSPTSVTHALGEQAFLLIDLGETTAAVDQLAYARSLATRTTSTLLRTWLAAAHGEALAAAGHSDDAQRAFDTADTLLPANPVDPDLPFLFLAGTHLDRWRGHALARLGAPEAIDQLTSALTRLPPDFVRARTGLLVDLTYAHAATGDRDTALTHARQARRLAAQIKSDRQLRRLNQLVLPGSSAP